MSKKQKSVLLALTDTHHGFYVGAARYAREHGWHLVTDMIYTASVRHDLERMDYEAAALLDHLMDGGTVPDELKSGDDGVTDIAVKTGYTRPKHLFRTFRRHFGISPRQYREQARLATAEEQAGIVRNLD